MLIEVPAQSPGLFFFPAGLRYFISIADNPEVAGNGGDFTLTVTEGPLNDDRSDATELSGFTSAGGIITSVGNLWNAIFSSGDPVERPNVWYSFVPAFSGAARILGVGSSTAVSIYNIVDGALNALGVDELVLMERSRQYFLELYNDPAMQIADEATLMIRRGSANDLFSEATSISHPGIGNIQTYSGTTFDSLNDNPLPTVSFDGGRPNVWYRFGAGGRQALVFALKSPDHRFTILMRSTEGNLRVVGQGDSRATCNIFLNFGQEVFVSISTKTELSTEGSPFEFTLEGRSISSMMVMPNRNFRRFTSRISSGNASGGSRASITIRRRTSFVFNSVVRCQVFDPYPTDTYVFEMLDGSLFTQIIDFPDGFSNSFEVIVGEQSLGTFSSGQILDFEEVLGAGVQRFVVTGILPFVDGDDPNAFPIGLSFNTERASFAMTPVGIDDEEPLNEGEALLDFVTNAEGDVSSLLLQTVAGETHELQKSSDLSNPESWQTVESGIEGDGRPRSFSIDSELDSTIFFRIMSEETVQ